jgi:ribosome biogenesis GTPase
MREWKDKDPGSPELTGAALGVVVRKFVGSYSVLLNGSVLNCSLSGQMQLERVSERPSFKDSHRKARETKTGSHSDPVAVGDIVWVQTGQNGGKITAVQPRRSHFSRRSAVPMPGAHAFEQVVAANVDQIVPVFSAANPPPRWNMLDRYLVSAESLDLPAVICLTKRDLLADQPDSLQAEFFQAVDLYRKIGYPVVVTSTLDGAGIAEIREYLGGKISVLVGKSGVGKTSLLNSLQPGLGLRVNAVSEVTGKGKHTTTGSELFPLDAGGGVIDTPGVREFGLWDTGGEDLAPFFPEMRAWLGKCKYGTGCRHGEEPGCAIRQAVADQAVHPRRYQSMLRLRAEGYFG